MSDLHNHNAIEMQSTVAIVGLGYVGLPHALLFVRKGFNVVGIDLDRRKVESIQSGKSYINEIKDQDIFFINEMALICDAIHLNVWEIIEAASTKPFGYNTFYPGPGIGGHCIPVDPSYLAWKLKQHGITSDFIHISNTINDGMPLYITQQLEHYLAPKPLSETRIMIYGVAYKPDIADYRESAAIGLIQSLHLKGADVVYHDPYVPSLQVGEHKLVSLALSAETLLNTDCVIIATDHTSLPLELVLEHAPFVYDTRNVVKGITGKSRIVTLGGGGS
ncbi:nucleotide sugar dehydrogenase [Paenibacillus sp. MCAF9]|uniref:nucleotide sugar dehydrogenase n=1 Tax=Paenibacillus sp. MCAF9 TaxID=3233046 RepID=UPI003F9DA361